MWIGFNKSLAEKHHYLKLTHKLNVRQMRYHRANSVVQTGYIDYAHEKLSMDSTDTHIRYDVIK